MPTETPFLLSIAAVSASLAGLAGLVAGLRRGPTLAPMELYRLREIVEFAFANVIVALSAVVLRSAIDPDAAVRVVAAGALLYLVADATILFRRTRRAGIPMTRPWLVAAGAIDALVIVVGLWAIVAPAITALEVLLVVLLSRPMVTFLFVLQSFEATEG